MTTKYCQNCGTQLQDFNVRFCSTCGSQLAPPTPQENISPATSEVNVVKTKLSPSGSNRMPRIIIATVLVLLIGGLTAVFLITHSIKFQLVGTWSNDVLSGSLGGAPNAWAETWEFRSDSTFQTSEGLRRGKGTYTILDDGSIKLEFAGGATVTGKLDSRRLIINWGKEQSVLYKF